MLKSPKYLSYITKIKHINDCFIEHGRLSGAYLMVISHLSDKTFHVINGFSGAFPGPFFQGFTADFIDQFLIFLISLIILLLRNNVSTAILWLLKLIGNQCTQAELIRLFNMRITNKQISI